MTDETQIETPKRRGGWPKGKPRGPRVPKPEALLHGTGNGSVVREDAAEPGPVAVSAAAPRRCDGCAHYFGLVKAGGELDETQGACRRYPPDFLGMQVAFRTVRAEWFCGEHRSK